jgi:hypothetical protein
MAGGNTANPDIRTSGGPCWDGLSDPAGMLAGGERVTPDGPAGGKPTGIEGRQVEARIAPVEQVRHHQSNDRRPGEPAAVEPVATESPGTPGNWPI